MRYPLAIFAPRIGTYSETFIRRHMEDILPGGTVVIATMCQPGEQCYWKTKAPALILNEEIKDFTNESNQVAIELKVEEFLIKNGVKVVLAEFLDFGLPVLKICKKLGLRFFVHAHGYDVSRCLSETIWRNAYKNYNYATGIITMSRKSKNDLIQVGLDSKKIHVIPYGVDIPSDQLKRKKNSKCLAVGRLIPKKGPLLMLEAFRKAHKKNSLLTLDIIGSGVMENAVKNFIKENRLKKCITYHGSQKHDYVIELMKQSDIFIQHSITDPDDGNQEGLPVAILEAMAHSMPVISTIHAGIPEAVIDCKTGFLVDEGDVGSMAEKILQISLNAELYYRFSSNALSRAQCHFSWNNQKKELIRVLGLTFFEKRMNFLSWLKRK